MIKSLFFLNFFAFALKSHAQISIDSTILGDTLKPLLVEAFSKQTNWKSAAASVALLKQTDLESASSASVLPAFNKISGVRLEERSPASYRVSIRGSLLRAPFGIRNTKVYWNDFPLSDATGNTYLNLLALQNMDAVEIIKGPSSSMYGANTGGVILLKSILPFTKANSYSIQAGTEGGADGFNDENLSFATSNNNLSNQFNITKQSSNGFREQSASKKLQISNQFSTKIGKHILDYQIWYTDLFYQTPGGITLAQMNLNPKLSRQAAGGFPSAIQQNASVKNHTIYSGIKDNWVINETTKLQTNLTINNTQFENPFITNYEFRNETNLSISSRLIKHFNHHTQWVSGFEWLYNHSVINDYGNKKAVVDTLQFIDQAFANQWTIYSQIQAALSSRIQFTTGISVNQQLYQYQRVSVPLSAIQHKNTQIVPAPRVSLLYEINNNTSLYSILAYGFSPASLAEIRPSDGNYYGDLEPERGWNFELGWKGFLMNHQLQYDIAYYHFQLNNTIVRRNNTAGAEYFINAGTTRQQGLEFNLNALIFKNKKGILNSLNIWTSFSYQPYRFLNYQQGNINFAGNWITGVPRTIFSSGIALDLYKKLQFQVSVNSVSKIPLTDANDAYADPYQLVQMKMNYPFSFGKNLLMAYLGADNLLNQLYSLGNDINAAGKRYYNPAAKRNFYIGIKYKFKN